MPSSRTPTTQSSIECKRLLHVGLCVMSYKVIALDDLLPSTRVPDVGCGNGSLAGTFLAKGCTVVGIHLGRTGVEIERLKHPGGRFEVLAAEPNLLENPGEPPFDIDPH